MGNICLISTAMKWRKHQQQKKNPQQTTMDIKKEIGILSTSYELGIPTGILHPKSSQLFYRVMFPDEGAFR